MQLYKLFRVKSYKFFFIIKHILAFNFIKLTYTM